jgi:hypothetical protein
VSFASTLPNAESLGFMRLARFLGIHKENNEKGVAHRTSCDRVLVNKAAARLCPSGFAHLRGDIA